MDGIRWRRKTLKHLVTKRSPASERGESVNGELTAKVEGEPLSPASRLFHQPDFNCHIIAIAGLGKRIDVDVLKTGLEVTLLRHPRFTSIHVIDEKTGEQKWVRTKVVLENHLVIPDLDPDMESPDEFVEDYVSDLTKTRLDTSKPLWEIHLLNVKTTEAEAVAVFRIHHSLGDGVSLMSLVLACTRKTADPGEPPTVPEKKVSLLKRGRNGPWAVLRSVRAVLLLVWNTILDVLLFVATAVFLKDTETPLKCAEGVECRPKRIVHRTLSLDDVKTVKSATNSTLNDVFLGITSAGLSRYLSGRCGDVKAPAKIRLRAAVLFNIRPTPRIQDLSDMIEKKNVDVNWGNWLGFVLVPFSVKTESDPLDYIRKAKAIVDRKKLSLESLFTFWSATAIVKCIGIKAAAALNHRILTHTTMSFSNVVGPMEEISYYGHPIVYLAPTVYGHPHALTIHFQSYMDKVKMVVAVDEDTIPDPHHLCDDLAYSLMLIKDAVQTKP